MNTLKKLSVANRAAFVAHMLPALPVFPGAFVRKLSTVLLLTSFGTVLTALPGWAVALKPTSVTVSIPTGSKNGTRDGSLSKPYVDDILLNTLVFPSATFKSTNKEFKALRWAEVVSGRNNVNAEFGDLDNNSDKNPNPFVTAGVVKEGFNLTTEPNPTRESINPTIQDPAIQAAFDSPSLSQGIDGELSNPFVLDLIFDNGILDNNSAVDQVPELVFFERGANSDFQVQAITGWTFGNPTFAPKSVTALRGQMFKSPVYIDTIEITQAQQLGVIGFDLNDFGLTASQALYGIRLTATSKSSGPDLYGQFITGKPNQFVPVPPGFPGTAVPFNFSPGLGILVLGAGGAIAQLNSQVQKWKSSKSGFSSN